MMLPSSSVLPRSAAGAVVERSLNAINADANDLWKRVGYVCCFEQDLVELRVLLRVAEDECSCRAGFSWEAGGSRSPSRSVLTSSSKLCKSSSFVLKCLKKVG